MDVGHARKVFLDGSCATATASRWRSRSSPWASSTAPGSRPGSPSDGVIGPADDGRPRGRRRRRGRSSPAWLLRSGETIAADFVVLAVPFDRVAALLPGHDGRPHSRRSRASARSQASPITGVHLWFDRPVCPFDHVVTVGRLIQWVFNHTAIQGRRPGDSADGQYLQLVISASYDLLGLDKTRSATPCSPSSREIWPAAREARSCSAGGSSPSTARPSPSGPASTPSAPPSGRRSRASSWPATGPPPAGPRRWKGPSAAATSPPRGCSTTSAAPSRSSSPSSRPGLLSRWLFGSSDERRKPAKAGASSSGPPVSSPVVSAGPGGGA